MIFRFNKPTTPSSALMSANSNSSDSLLVKLAASGCQDAIREIVSRYQGKLMSFLNKRGSSTSDTEDILQETFISAFDSLQTFDPARSFSAWIFGIARNKANLHHRKVVRIANIQDRIEQPEIDSSTPSGQLDEREQSHTFWQEARRLLNDDQFTSLWLRYQENLSVAEIAEALDKSVSNVKIFLFRARKALAKSQLLAEQRTKPHQLTT